MKQITNTVCEKNIEPPTQDTKDSILLSQGLAVTYRSFKHGKRSCRAISEPEYTKATEALSNGGFGQIVTFTIPRGSVKRF